MKYYVSVDVMEKRNLRIVLDSNKKPTKKSILAALQKENYQDIPHEESLKYMSVDFLEILSVDEENEEVV